NGYSSLPREIVKVDFKYTDLVNKETIPMELWAGFIGLKQNRKDFTLMPEIGWMVRERDTQADRFAHNKKFEDGMNGFGIHIRVNEFPPQLLQLKTIKSLTINFTDSI